MLDALASISLDFNNFQNFIESVLYIWNIKYSEKDYILDFVNFYMVENDLDLREMVVGDGDSLTYRVRDNNFYEDDRTTYYDLERISFNRQDYEEALKKSGKSVINGKRFVDASVSEDGLWGGPCGKGHKRFDVNVEIVVDDNGCLRKIDYYPKEEIEGLEDFRESIERIRMVYEGV